MVRALIHWCMLAGVALFDHLYRLLPAAMLGWSV
jgi:hypothetical protein